MDQKKRSLDNSLKVRFQYWDRHYEQAWRVCCKDQHGYLADIPADFAQVLKDARWDIAGEVFKRGARYAQRRAGRRLTTLTLRVGRGLLGLETRATSRLGSALRVGGSVVALYDTYNDITELIEARGTENVIGAGAHAVANVVGLFPATWWLPIAGYAAVAAFEVGKDVVLAYLQEEARAERCEMLKELMTLDEKLISSKLRDLACVREEIERIVNQGLERQA